MKNFNYDKLNWHKLNGIIPAIIQDAETGTVLMLGFMNEEALCLTLETKKITFFSRTKNKIWVKGETSGNYLSLENIFIDCDQDTLLIFATPAGPTCHTGSKGCFENTPLANWQLLPTIESLITKRAEEMPENSYTASLLNKGINKITQKVGEEAVETVIAGLNEDDESLCNETADLIYHVLVLLAFRRLSFSQVLDILKGRLKLE